MFIDTVRRVLLNNQPYLINFVFKLLDVFTVAEARGDLAKIRAMASQCDDVDIKFEAARLLIENGIKDGLDALYYVATSSRSQKIRVEAAKMLYHAKDPRGRDSLVSIVKENVDPMQSLGAVVILYNNGHALLTGLAMQNAGREEGLIMTRLLVRLNDIPAAKKVCEEGIKRAGRDAFIWRIELEKIKSKNI